jgi:hypothetical protein
VDGNPSGAWGTNTYSIDRNNLAANWMYHGRLFPNITSPGSCFLWQSGAGAVDLTTNQIWKAADAAVDCGTGSNGVFKIACATTVAAGGQASTGPAVPGSTIYNTYMPSPVWGGWSAILTDRAPAKSWVVGSTQGGRNAMYVMDLVNAPGVWQPPISTTGSARWLDGDGGVYHAASKAFLVFGVTGATVGTGGVIYKLAVSPGDPKLATYTWSQVVNASNAVLPATDQGTQFNSIYSKLQLINDMGNGQGALIAICAYRGPVYVYKLPAAGV